MSHELLKTIATVEYQKEMDEQLRQGFPLVASTEDLSKYWNKESVQVAFSPIPGFVTDSILKIALQRAGDVKDAAFCSHGNEHKTFPEALEYLSEDIDSKTAYIRLQPTVIEARGKKGKAKVTRLVIEGSERQRDTSRPAPHQAALELKARIQEGHIDIPKVIRKLAGEYGVPFALMTSIYYGLEAGDALQVFYGKPVRESLLNSRRHFGVRNPKIPHPSEALSDKQMLEKIIRDVTFMTAYSVVAKPSADAYLNALNYFRTDYRRDVTPEMRQFIATTDNIMPVAVFAGLDEIAHNIVNPSFKDPYRSEYILERYSQFGTTKMITAYCDFLPTSPNGHFHRFWVKNKLEVQPSSKSNVA